MVCSHPWYFALMDCSALHPIHVEVIDKSSCPCFMDTSGSAIHAPFSFGKSIENWWEE
jgi:hypothetical protein